MEGLVDPESDLSRVRSRHSSSDRSPRPSLRSPRKTKARRYGFACSNCKSRKVKCSGDQPVCSACQQSGMTCTRSGDKQLQHAKDRIRQLEQALAESQVQVLAQPQIQPQVQPQVQPQAQPQALSQAQGPDSLPSSGSPIHDNRPSPASTRSPAFSAKQTTTPALWFHVGRGDDGAVIYNGPTSRFHVGPLDDDATDESQTHASTAPTTAAIEHARRASHIEALTSQYSLLNNLRVASVNYGPHFEKSGLDSAMCMKLLDIYWTWLQPLHNCVYRPSKLFTTITACARDTKYLILLF